MSDDSTFQQEYQQTLQMFRRYLEGRLGLTNDDSSVNDSTTDKTTSLETLRQQVHSCRKCPLHATRRNVVFGAGNPAAPLMFIGEAPGRDEDLQGKPFVGAAGRLLREALKQVGISLEDVFIANILKCRPPKNRDPDPEEIAMCLPYLKSQIELIQPRFICTLGKFASQNILSTTQGITALRGRTFPLENAQVLPTYHPAACIYRPGWKEQFLQDLQKLRALLQQPG